MKTRTVVGPMAIAFLTFVATLGSVCVVTADNDPEARAASLPLVARSKISAVLGRNEPGYYARTRDGAFDAANAAQHLTVHFSSQGVKVSTGSSRSGMTVRAYGYGNDLRVVSRPALKASFNRVEYRRGPFEEWYINGPEGLEQGFTIAEPPGSGNGRPLTIALQFSGNLRPLANPDGTSLILSDSEETRLRYTGLAARDAIGRHLRASLEVRERQVFLRVNDSGAQYPVVVDPIIQLAELTSSDAGAGDAFGTSVAISGDTIVAGAPSHAVGTNAQQGATYIFVKPANGWANTSTFSAELTASDGIAGDSFGSSVAINGDTIVVGACNLSGVCSNGPGKAYVFVKPASGWATTSAFNGKLTASDVGVGADGFGIPVSIGGDTVVIGSAQNNGTTNNGPGKAYVFVKPAAGWATMTETAMLTASDGANGDGFGLPSISNDGNTIFVGAFDATVGTNVQQGAGYIYLKPSGGWTTTSQFDAKLTASDGQPFDVFGFCQNSVCISGDGNTVIAGAPQVNFSAAQTTGPGKAYVFVKPASGWATTSDFDAELTSSDGQRLFGWSVALSNAGDEAVIGAEFGAGSAYEYSRPASGWATTSTFDAKLIRPNGAANDALGFSVGVDAGTVVAGAPSVSGAFAHQGAVDVFGEGNPFDISAATGVTVSSPGQSGSTAIAVSPNGGFTGTVTLSCTPDPNANESDCSFTSGSNSGSTLQVNLNGSSANLTLNVTTTGPHSVAAIRNVPLGTSGILAASVMLLLLIPVARRRRRTIMSFVVLAFLLILGGCGGGGGGGSTGHTDPGTPAGNYTFTVTGTSGSGSGATTVSTSVAVTVQ